MEATRDWLHSLVCTGGYFALPLKIRLFVLLLKLQSYLPGAYVVVTARSSAVVS